MPNTKQARERREAFVRKHHQTFRRLTEGDKKYNPPRTSPDVAAFVNDVARPELSYAAGTDADSIWFTLHRCYKKLYPHAMPS